VLDRQSAATGSAPGSSSQAEADRQVNRPHTESGAREIESQHICEAKSFGRSLLKVKWKYENPLLAPLLKPAAEGDVDT
jgi:hypothetical protein